MALAPGQLVGNYQVLSRLGVGGMGAVYLAEHPIIGKKVALKVIHKELSANREVIGRFYQEARAVNLIGNEHIVEIHDFGQSPEGDHFFVMEYVDGKTLAQILARERILDVRRALHVSAQIALALAAAHAAGIIHRDLKPDNVMITTRSGDTDFVKLLDFGLAKVMAEGGVKNLTAAGVILGTPQYMSPEACESKKVDHRTDVYALGVLLFQMLCGQVPFDADTMGGVLIKQVTQAPPAPRGLSPLIPPAVEQIILRCLAKAPDARFPTMTALYEALIDPDRYLATSPAAMPAAQPSAKAQAATMYAVSTNAAMGYAATAGFPAASTAAFALAGTAQVPLAAAAAAVGPTRTSGPIPLPPATMMDPAPPPAGYPGGGYPPAPAPTHPTAHQGATMIGAPVPLAPPLAPPPMTGPAPMAGPPPMAGPRRVTAAAIPIPANHTLVLPSPARPRRRSAPLLAAIAAVVVIGAVVGLVVVAGGGSEDAPAGAPDAAVAVAQVAPLDAAAPPIDAAPLDAVAPARIEIASVPPGAVVTDVDGQVLGTTPLTLTWPADGRTRVVEFTRAGSKSRTKEIVVTGDLKVEVVLESDGGGRPGGRRPGRRPGPGSGAGRPPPDDGIMEPKLR